MDGMMDATAWIHLGILVMSVAVAAGAVIRVIGSQAGLRFDRIDLQFTKVDLKFDFMTQQFNERFDKLRDQGNDRHIANIERLARLEGQITALPQRVQKAEWVSDKSQ
jgi:hypothetical protein